MDEFKEKLKKLKEKRRQASQANFKEVLEENERLKKPANYEKQLERNLQRLQREEEKLKAEELGVDYEIKKSLDYRADEIDRWEKSRGPRKDNSVFVDFEEATKRQYNRCIKQIKPDLEEYAALKNELGEEKFYLRESESDGFATQSTAKHVSELTKDSQKGIERMVEEVQKQIETRSKRSRKRKPDEDADVDYINERNMKYNKILEKYYGEYTDEIKKNFERGTAI